jgi:NAD(P) transhydrogenase
MSHQPKTYDLIVIGGGPAGLTGVTTASILGKSVALVDRHHELGGAGANTGTVPSKTLRETAVALSGLRSRELYGVDLSIRREATVGDFLRHERNVKSGLNAMFAQQLEAFHADVFFGNASFDDPHTIRVQTIPKSQAKDQHKAEVASDDREVLIRGEKILIATGSSPVRPSNFPYGHGVYDSDTLLDLVNIPKTMAVVGAGTIGSEYASTFAALGTQVHIVDSHNDLMPFLDGEISRALLEQMQRNGIVFHWKERAVSCSAKEWAASGKLGQFTLKLSSGDELTVDEVLVSVGRHSNVESLNLPAAGVALGDDRLISVNSIFQTNVPHIYAAGDVIGFPALASTSMEQARRAVRHSFGMGVYTGTPRLLPHGIWTIPEIGMVGETEESLKTKGTKYVIGRALYCDNARGRISGDTHGFLKLVFGLPDLELLGAHVIGELATDVVHIGMMAILAHAGAKMFDETCFNVPTLGALYKMAAFDAILRAQRHAGIPAAHVLA